MTPAVFVPSAARFSQTQDAKAGVAVPDAERGDWLTRMRLIDHIALIDTIASEIEAAKRLKRAKFATEQVHGPDGPGRYSLSFIN